MSDNKKPNIRFKGYSDDWEQRKFGEVLETVTDYVAAGSFADLAKNVEYKDYPDYAQLIRTKDLKNGFTSTQEVYVNKNAFDYLYRVNMDKECIILPNIGNCGEVYYVKPESLPYEHNVLGPNAIFVRSETCANNFLSILFQAKDFQTKLKLIVSPNGQTKFNKTELKGIDLILPRDVYEQEKIGQYFSNLDRLITLHQRKCDQIKELKKYMLKKMFPQNGAKVPEIRFDGFTDDWEQRKVQEVADRFDNLRIPVAANLRVHGTTPYYGANGIQDYVEGFTHDGEFVLVAEDGANDLKNYPVKCVNGRIWVNNHAHVLQGKAGIADNSFLAFAISQSDIESLLVGGGRAKLNAETLMSIEFRLPCLQEQYRIGEYLTQLDHLITLHQRELEKLQNLKKSLLNSMFI